MGEKRTANPLLLENGDNGAIGDAVSVVVVVAVVVVVVVDAKV